MNPQHVKTGINLEDAEKTVMGKAGSGRSRVDADPVRIYTAELNQLAEELGIDLLDDGDAAAPTPQTPSLGGPPPSSRGRGAGGLSAPGGRAPPPMRGGQVTDLIDDINFDDDDDDDEDDDEVDDDNDDDDDDDAEEEFEECDCDDDCPDECDCECHEEDDEEEDDSYANEDDEKVDRIISRLESDLGIQTDGKRERRRNRIGRTEIPAVERRQGGRDTNEQERRRHINSVVSDIRGETRTTFGVERERIQDIKASKLEKIGQLRMTLEEEGIDCSSVSNPTTESPVEEIDSVLNILRLKNDRNRYSSLAEEVILGLAEGVETVFDGSRTVPLVGWRPDYTGYHNTVNVKLHRMRFETSQVVGNIIQKYNVGPTARIVMELLPSFFLYPRQQKKQRGTPGLSSDPHVSDARGAFNAIREADERKSLDDLRQI